MPRRAHRLREYFLLNINPVVRFLILSDTVIVSGLSLLGPIFALFIVEFIEGATAATAGIAAAIYLISKSVLQLPIASLIDRIRGERDDFWLLFVGTTAAAIMPLLYLLISTPGQLYLVQFVYGLLAAAMFPSFMAIYTRHIDKGREGSEWGVYFTLTDLSAAATAAIGGILAEAIGFQLLIVCVALVGLVGALLIIPIRPYLKGVR